MELINGTRMQAGCTMGLKPDGRELLVVVIKGTFVLPVPGEAVRLHDEQMGLVMADTFTGAPGLSAPVYEVDYAPGKRACDVLLLGSAHVPTGPPVTRLQVGLRVGPLAKRIDVVGNRVWEAGLTTIHPSPPRPFMEQPISYDVAFGGVDRMPQNPADHAAFLPNPVGRGWCKHLKNAWVDGKPLPNTEEPGEPVTWPANSYKPMAFGPVGRSWPERSGYAGTYDERWVAEVCPFLPADFDERYFQAAPPDQQLPVPREPLQVVLTNLTPDGLREFVLPHFEAPVHVFPKRGEREDLIATLDTIVFEPDAARFTMSWRAVRPLKRDMLEIAQVLVGRKGREWWQQRDEVTFPIPVVMVPMTRGDEAS